MNADKQGGKTLEDLIKGCEITVPSNLEALILTRIDNLRHRSQSIKIAILSSLSILSLFGVVASFFALGRALAQSGFNNYLYLIFSEGVVFTTYWREAILSMLESLPTLYFAPLLIVVGIFIWSSTKTWTNVKQMMSTV